MPGADGSRTAPPPYDGRPSRYVVLDWNSTLYDDVEVSVTTINTGVG